MCVESAPVRLHGLELVGSIDRMRYALPVGQNGVHPREARNYATPSGCLVLAQGDAFSSDHLVA